MIEYSVFLMKLHTSNGTTIKVNHPVLPSIIPTQQLPAPKILNEKNGKKP
jgi:hypothetical protein